MASPRTAPIAFAVGAALLLVVLPVRARAPKPLAEAAEEQLKACVSLPRPNLALQADPSVAPPLGLARGTQVIVAEIPTDRGKLYAYRDRGGRELVCGIAVYGVDPKPIAERLIGVIEASPLHLLADPVPHYTLANAKPGRARYFGDPRAPGVSGVTLVERPDRADAPCLEADFHQVLVF